MKHTLMVCDKNKQYANKVAGYINSKDGFPFEARVPNTLERAEFEKKGLNIDIILIDEHIAGQTTGYASEADIILLSGDSLKQDGNRKVIYKYQSIDGIIKELLLYASSKDNLKNLICRKNQMKIIGLFSPIRRSGQTTLGLAIGQNLSRKYRTLFISLDCYGGISKEITTIPWSGDLSDLLYSINNDAKDISTLIGGASGSIGSLDIMPPMDRHYDLISISFEEWRRFLRHIEDQTDYEFVILDMSKAVQGLTQLIALCNKLIVTVVDEEKNRSRLESYMKEIESIENIERNTKYINIPEELLSGKPSVMSGANDHFGEFAKEIIKEIVA